MKTVAILGITGSIGTTALRGIRTYCNDIHILAASVNTNVQKALDICSKFNIPNLCITSDAPYSSTDSTKIFTDISDMLNETKPDIVLNGIGGSAGLSASISAIEANCKLALANKETVVVGGNTFFDFVKKHNGTVIPVDSEHSAIDELIRVHGIDNIEKLIITASGGPFFDKNCNLSTITPEIAANHPTWKMGAKISIDSSTLANKGLEVMEAHYLFGFSPEQIEVTVHPQSIVHSMVQTKSGQVYAQLYPPDMVVPIMRALTDNNYNRRIGDILDFSNLELTFKKLDNNRFPFVGDAYDCIIKGGIYPAVFTVADEIAVEKFIRREILFTQIRDEVKKALDMNWTYSLSDIHDAPTMLETIRQRILA